MLAFNSNKMDNVQSFSLSAAKNLEQMWEEKNNIQFISEFCPKWLLRWAMRLVWSYAKAVKIIHSFVQKYFIVKLFM